MKDLYLIGAGGCGREVLNMILDVHAIQGPKWNIKGFLDDTENPLSGKVCDYSVVGTIRDYTPKPNDALLMCIADPIAKKKLVHELKAKGAFFDSFISPWIYAGRHNTIGEGTIIFSGFSMSVNITIGNFVTLLNCSLGHDAQVGDYSTISTNCGLMGNSKVGKNVFLGDGARIAPNVTVGDNAYVCMGSIVLKNVEAGDKVLGNPARVIGNVFDEHIL